MAGVADTEKPTIKLWVGFARLRVADEITEFTTFREFLMSPPCELQTSRPNEVVGDTVGLMVEGRRLPPESELGY